MFWQPLKDCQCGHAAHPGLRRCRACVCNEYEPASAGEINLKDYYGLEPGLLLLVLE